MGFAGMACLSRSRVGGAIHGFTPHWLCLSPEPLLPTGERKRREYSRNDDKLSEPKRKGNKAKDRGKHGLASEQLKTVLEASEFRQE